MTTRVLALEISDEKLRDYYVEASIKHNDEIRTKGSLADSGFDLICPTTIETTRSVNRKCFTKLINLRELHLLSSGIQNIDLQNNILIEDLKLSYMTFNTLNLNIFDKLNKIIFNFYKI